jgi:hypothetical protein
MRADATTVSGKEDPEDLSLGLRNLVNGGLALSGCIVVYVATI